MGQKLAETWRRAILIEMLGQGETWKDIVACTLSDKELDAPFDSGYGALNGEPFTVWTAKRVYFPVGYNGSEWCCSVSRNPDGQPTKHIGGAQNKNG